MIENDRQYRVTKTQLGKLKLSLSALKEREDEEKDRPIIFKAQCDSLESMIEDLEEEIKEYEQKKAGDSDGH